MQSMIACCEQLVCVLPKLHRQFSQIFAFYFFAFGRGYNVGIYFRRREMLTRVTDIMKNSQTVRNLGRHQVEFDRVQNQLATGKRIRRPADDPSSATNQMYFRTRIEELAQFEDNIGEAKSRLNMLDGELSRVTDILQRVRVLTVQAANGIYQGDNFFALREAVAAEVDQHLRALVDVANGRDSTGRPLFGGHNVSKPPFEVIHANVSGLRGEDLEDEIVGVRYRGDVGKQLREVERDQFVTVNLPGNHAFWGTNMTVTGDVDTGDYTVLSDQAFRINGSEIKVAAGDTIDDIIDKINRAGISVEATKVGQNNISLHTTSPHQLWLEDIGSSTVLKDIGLLSLDPDSFPNEYAESARVSGLSSFDMLIKLRDDLRSGDQLEIGGRDLGNLDQTINTLLGHRAQSGARFNRLEEHEKRVAWDHTYMTELLAKNEGVDIPEAIINLKWLESVHNYALNVGARIIKPQLMDFLR